MGTQGTPTHSRTHLLQPPLPRASLCHTWWPTRSLRWPLGPVSLQLHLQLPPPIQPTKWEGPRAPGQGSEGRVGLEGKRLEGREGPAAGSSPLTSAPVTGCGLQGALSVARAGDFSLPPAPPMGGSRGAEQESGAGNWSAPGIAPQAQVFPVCFYLARQGRPESRVPSCSTGSPPRARPGGSRRERNPNTGRSRDRQGHPTQGSRPAHPGGRRHG